MPSNVDLPEPFSPTRAWTSPARQSKLTFLSARTAPNWRDTPASSRTTSWFIPVLERLARSGEHLGEHAVGSERGPRHHLVDTIGIAVGRCDLSHHMRDHDLAGDLAALLVDHRRGDGDARLEVASRRVPDVVGRLRSLGPIAE